MKATFISRENNDVKFTMEFTAEEFENAQIKAYQAAKDQFQIDGFRKGKAPRSIIEKHYGEGVFFEEAIDQLFRESYGEALKELDLEVVDAPAAEFSKIAKGEGFTITITVPCFPIIAVKDYQGVEIEKVSQEVKDEDIDNELKALQKRNARMILVERPAQDGDTVLLDYSGFVGDEQFEGGTAERQELTLGSGMFIPGFEEQLVGATPGEKRDVTVTFPAEYHAEELAGKEAVFHCLVHEIKEEQLPELDDEFAKDVSEFDTLEALRDHLREECKADKEKQAQKEFEYHVLEKLVEQTEFDIPPAMVDYERDRMLQEYNSNFAGGGMSLEQYINMTGATVQQFLDSLREDALLNIKKGLVLDAIAKQENVEVTDEDVDAYATKLGEGYGMSLTEIKSAVPTDNLEGGARVDKAARILYDAAVHGPAEEEKKEETAEKTEDAAE